MKRQMVNVERLRFPSGIAAAETLRTDLERQVRETRDDLARVRDEARQRARRQLLGQIHGHISPLNKKVGILSVIRIESQANAHTDFN